MKKIFSVLLGFIMIFTMLPSGVFAASAKENIAYSDFYSVEDSYYSYIEPSAAMSRSNSSGAVQAISDAVAAVAESVDISIYGVLTSQMQGIFTNEISSNPAFFYLGGISYSYNPSTNIVATVSFTYHYTTVTIQQMQADYETAITKVLSWIKVGMSDAEKVLAMHDYLVLNAKYDYENYLAETIPRTSYTSYGILVLGVGVCEGYALAFKELMTRLDIPVVKLSSSAMNHAWNMVYLDGKWYHVDVSSDDPIYPAANGWFNNDYDMEGSVSHEFFLLSDSDISDPNKHDYEHFGWAPSTNAADSNLYDSKYANIKSGMFWYQGYWYYNNGGSLTRSLFNLSSSSVIKAINGVDNNYSYLGVFNNEIYYNITASNNSTSEIRKCKFDGTQDTQVLLINNTGQTIKEKITELVIQDNIIKYTVYRWNSSSNQVVGYAVRYHTILVAPPAAPTLSQTPTTPTNGNVSVTINYPADVAVKEYKIGSAGVWTAYTAAVVLTANNTLYARCKYEFGDWSNTASITVSNIDKTAPATPTLSQNPTTPTNGNVTVAISYPADSVVKEYRIGTGAWITYTAPIVLGANSIVYARAKDAAGNTSNSGSITVGNIGKLVARTGSTTIIDPGTGFIYGLKTGLTKTEFENNYIQISGNVRLEYEFIVAGALGTGTKVKLVDNTTQQVFATYIIIILGDLNGDAAITASDALMVLKACSGSITLNSVQQPAGDVDISNTISASDSLRILKYVSGSITEF